MDLSNVQLVERFRAALKRRGTRGIMGIGRSFRIADDDRSGSLCMEEFKKCMRDFRVGISAEDAERLFKLGDADRSGKITYEEFLRHVRGEMNEFRTGLAMRAFAIMDSDGSGSIDISDVKLRYNAKKDPRVISGQLTEDEVLYQFIDTFE